VTTLGDRLRGWRKRVRGVLFRRSADADLAAEMAWHVEQETEHNLRLGMGPREARRAALLTFGGMDRFAESVRDERGFGWLEALRQDVGHAVRSYRRTPGLALAILLTLALGIGGATAIFGVVDRVMLRPLPYPHADRLVNILETTPAGAGFSVSEPNFLDLAAHNRTFDVVAAYRLDGTVAERADAAERLQALSASHGLFDVLGVQPVLGRRYAPAEDRPGAAEVVVLSHAYWQREFAGSRSVIGSALRLDGTAHTIIGVLPESATFLQADIWRPLAADASGDRADHWLQVIGRLSPGIALGAAAADLERIATGFGAAEPEVAGWSVRLEPLLDAVVGTDFRTAGVLLLGCVTFLLLMACANVTNLLLGRATTRQTDLGIRIALGIGRPRLLRQLFAESAVLASAGAALGVIGAHVAISALKNARPEFIPRIDEIGIDVRVLLFALAVTAATALLTGLLPALQSVRVDVHGALKQSGRSGATRGQQRVRSGLVVAQVALAAMLLVGGGLMLRSALAMGRIDTGFQTQHVWAVPLQINPAQFDESWQVSAFYHRVENEIASVPGVTAVGATSVTPFGGLNLVNDVTPEDRAADAPSSGYMQAAWRVVTPGWFEAAAVTLLRGRVFDHTDTFEQDHVVVITRSLAERLWGDADAVGRRLYWGGTSGRLRTVIGVIADIRDFELAGEAAPTMFLSTRQIAWPQLTLLVRTDGAVPGIESAIRSAVRTIDAGLPVPIVQPLSAQRDQALAQPRLQAAVTAAFATIALLLAVVGLYGVMSFSVARYTREIGVRMALGARAREVRAAFVRRGMTLVALGLAIGLLGAAALSRLIAGLLHGTGPLDLVTFAAVATLFMAVGLTAAVIPAQRAARIQPVVALRSE
jgi:putative ABC transport system permease protein